MQIFHNPEDMQQWALEQRQSGTTVSLVPTMGFLHEAHLSLVRLAKQKGQRVVVSIFVNPTQFGPHEDLDRYPRNQENDLALCKEEGVDIVFIPDAASMYLEHASVFVDSHTLQDCWEGALRPGHFKGVLTVVAKLFNLVLPTCAVFGEKDAQQLFLIQRMVHDLNWPVTIVPGPIVREPDGLAMSSRNVYLNDEERLRAQCIYKGLQKANEILAGGERSATSLKTAVLGEMAPGDEADYIVVVDEATFEPVDDVRGRSRLLVAARFGKTRLLDNLQLNP